jgi:hypothetical protein
LKHVGKYVNNKIYGKYKEYYPNGNIESIRFIENNNDMGEASWYYLNGQIEQYSFYDDFGRTIFKAQYDKDGVLKIAEGWILLEIYQNKLRANGKQRKYNIGDKIKYQYMFPNIPNTDRKFHIELKGYDNSKIKRKTRHIEPVTLEIEEEVVKKGKNEIIAYVEYKFKDVRREILRDSVSFEFEVR